MMMAMVRLNVPSVFIYGGSILPGKAPAGADVPEDFMSRDLTVQDMFEAVGRHQNGSLSDAALDDAGAGRLPLGRGLRRPVHRQHHGLRVRGDRAGAVQLLRHARALREPRPVWRGLGPGGDDLIEKNIRARDIVTRKTLENAARVVACTGGSTNAGLHLPAIAHEAGIDFYLDDVCEIFRDTPYFVDLKPGGQFVAKDLYDAGGMPVVMKELRKAGLMHEDCMTASGYSIGEELDKISARPTGKLIHTVDNPITKTGGVVGLKGNLAPDGAIVKVAGMSPRSRSSPAPPASSNARRMPSRPSRRGPTRKARCSSSATRAPPAAPACARCWRPPPPCRARAWARRWR